MNTVPRVTTSLPWQLAPEGLVPLALGSAFLEMEMLRYLADRSFNIIDGTTLFVAGGLASDDRYLAMCIAVVCGLAVSISLEIWSDRNA